MGAGAEAILEGLNIKSMNMRDAGTGALMWDEQWWVLKRVTIRAMRARYWVRRRGAGWCLER